MTFLASLIVCSGLLYIPYAAWLQREKMYLFTRAYLLCALLASVAIPLLPAPVLPSVENATQNPITYVTPIIKYLNQTPASSAELPNSNIASRGESKILPTSTLALLVIWVVTSMVLYVRFGYNLYALWRQKKSAEQLSIGNTNLYLSNNFSGAYSFGNAIFLCKAEYYNSRLNPAIIWHEQIHVNQRHSVDNLYAEIMICMFWFNPFFYWYKRAIQTNHELLADDGVLRRGCDLRSYQQLIMAQSAPSNTMNLSSNFNFYTIKKRLVMMHKNTSPLTKTWKIAASLAIVVTAYLLTSHSVKSQPKTPTVMQIDESKAPVGSGVTQELFDEYNAEISNAYDSVTTNSGKRMLRLDARKLNRRKLDSIYYNMSATQRNEAKKCMLVPTRKLPPNTVPTKEQFERFKNAASYGVWIDDKRVKNSVLSKYSASEFADVFISKLYGAAKQGRSYTHQVNLMTWAYYNKYVKDHYANTYQPPTK